VGCDKKLARKVISRAGPEAAALTSAPAGQPGGSGVSPSITARCNLRAPLLSKSTRPCARCKAPGCLTQLHFTLPIPEKQQPSSLLG
jgi:hypothetical protein